MPHLPGPTRLTLCGTSCHLHPAGIRGPHRLCPSCEDLAVSAGSVPKTGFIPALEDYFIASSLQGNQENRGGGGQEQGGRGAAFNPLCSQLVRKVLLIVLSSPTEDAAEAPCRASYSSPAHLALWKSRSLLQVHFSLLPILP